MQMISSSDLPRLPVLQTLLDALLVPLRLHRSFIPALLIPGSILIVRDVLAWMDIYGDSIGGLLMYGGIKAIAFVLLAITCHRNVLLGPSAVPRYGVLEWKWREWRYIGWALIAYLYMYALFVLFAGTAGIVATKLVDMHEVMFLILLLLACLPGVYAFARVSLLFPAVALDHKAGWDWAWKSTEGNGWRMVVVIMVFPMLLFWVPDLLSGIHLTLDMFLSILYVLLLAVEITALSLSYRFFEESRQQLEPVITFE